MPDTLSLLSHSKLPLAKTWHADGTISDYSKPKHFSLTPHEVHNIHDLSLLLTILEKRTNTCIIRGAYTGNTPRHTMRRKEVFTDQPLHVFMAEIDKYRPALFDPVLEPIESIEEYITTQLPECFHSSSYHWQLSNSAGSTKNAGVLKAHVWFWLETPYTSAQIRAWIKNNNIPLDPATADIVQIHYTAGPIFEDIPDPIPHRSGCVYKHSSVPLVLDPDSAEAKAKETPKGESYQGNDPIASWLEENHFAKDTGDNGKIFLDCPFSAAHTDGKTAQTDTTYLPPRAGFPDGIFHCSHASCSDRTNSDFENELGYTASLFDLVTETDENVSKENLTNTPNRFPGITAGEFSRRPPVKWLIKSILPERGFYEFYGGSGDGKTFAVLDMMLSLCRGIDWNGYKVKRPCKVAYLCAEGAGGFVSRLQAYAAFHKVDLDRLDLVIFPYAPDFRKMKDITDLATQINASGQFDVVIVDTLAQVTPGADENTGKDMSVVLAHCAALMRFTHAGVGLVHHTGKDVSKGARGWSGQKAPLDAQFLITKDEAGKRKFWVDKLKDARDGFGFDFELETVNFGEDEDGDILNSCIVKYVGASNSKTKREKPRKKGKNENLVYDAFMNLGGGEITFAALVDECLKFMPQTATGRRDKRPMRIAEALETLSNREELLYKQGMVSAPL